MFAKSLDPPLRVVQVLFDDHYGGPHKRIALLATRLSASGIDISLCIPEGSGNAAALAGRAGVPTQRVAMRRIPRPNRPLDVLGWAMFLPRDVRRFVSLFRNLKCDIVHVSGAFFLAPAIAARLAGKPLVWHLNDTIVPRSIAPCFGLVVRLLASRVVAQGESLARHYGVPEGRYENIYPPVDIDHFAPKAPNHSPPSSRTPVRLGLISNWNRIKGIEYFVQALALLRSRLGARPTAVFAGARPPSQAAYCAQIDELIDRLELADTIEDHGFMEDTLAVLRTLDILVMSSRAEGCPMIVLEAMATGIPVVATDVGSVREILLRDPDKPAGIVVPPRDAGAIANAVVELVKKPEVAMQMGQAGHRLAVENFALPRYVEAHRQLYRELAWTAPNGVQPETGTSPIK